MAKIYCKSSYLLRKDTAENWGNKNPVLRKGEQGLETDTGIMKIGDGITAFNNLPGNNIYFPKSYANATFANALKGTASGYAILIDDVSPVPHDMGVKISSNTITDLTAVKVKRCGKNLIPYPYYETTKTVDGTLTFTDNGDGSITVNGTTSVNASFVLVHVANSNVSLPSGQVFTLSGCPSGGSNSSYKIFGASGSPNNSFSDYGNGASFTSNGKLSLSLFIYAGATFNNLTFYPQVELGDAVTDYEPYITPTEYTPAADGTVNGVTSLYPNTTLMSDTDGVLIDCEYNRDINKFSGVDVDLTGYVKNTDINQSYDPTSENAQSGKAVAGAITEAIGGINTVLNLITEGV